MKTLFTVLALLSSITLFKSTDTLFKLQLARAPHVHLSTALFEKPISNSEQNLVFSLKIDKQKDQLLFIDSLLNTLILEIIKIIGFTLVLGFGISGISIFISQKDSLELF